MCQLQPVFHHACAHWAPRPRLVGEPCVRAHRVPIVVVERSASRITASTSTNITTTASAVSSSSATTTAVSVTIPCDYPFHLGAADEAGECAECVRRAGGRDAGEDDDSAAAAEASGLCERRGSVDSTATWSTGSSSAYSAMSAYSYGGEGIGGGGGGGGGNGWRPFAGVSEGGWEELRRVRERREAGGRGVEVGR
ncbi:uncharacterized protein BKCO1_8900017 [Diplodia corticola]|uniref:Uncharacterized protein n=1 Tax=Diplodia corticola TaxID=236234 RepID=A0A1J9RNM5_9PEZI|nr:uncharacterized protein BKCO1_8900017 [Diplodia corticola]OJD29189.1 hypothetical protein BKCO1_8900017 [Diplodia corticola]